MKLDVGLPRLGAGSIATLPGVAVDHREFPRCARWKASTVPALTTPRACWDGAHPRPARRGAPAAAAAPPTMVTVIVRLQAGATWTPSASAPSRGREKYRSRAVLRGFAVQVPVRLVDALPSAPAVVAVELDTPVPTTDTQSPAEWGLDRIDHGRCRCRTPTPIPVPAPESPPTCWTPGCWPGTTTSAGACARPTPRSTTAVAPRLRRPLHPCRRLLAGASYGVAKQAGLVPVRVLTARAAAARPRSSTGLDGWRPITSPARRRWPPQPRRSSEQHLRWPPSGR